MFIAHYTAAAERGDVWRCAPMRDALKALGWSAAIIIFCALVQLMTRFDGWMRGLGFGFLMVGNRAYAVWFGRFVQVLALGIGIYGLVQILSD